MKKRDFEVSNLSKTKPTDDEDTVIYSSVCAFEVDGIAKMPASVIRTRVEVDEEEDGSTLIWLTEETWKYHDEIDVWICTQLEEVKFGDGVFTKTIAEALLKAANKSIK